MGGITLAAWGLVGLAARPVRADPRADVEPVVVPEGVSTEAGQASLVPGVGARPLAPASSSASPARADEADAQPEGEGEGDARERTVYVPTAPPRAHEDRAASVVTREQFDQRLPRSSPDALRYEPGVYLQQTAHGQGSPYIRGFTGQQVAYLFDGIRLNNSIYRAGPNQYVFTVDIRTIERYEVVRGPASTRYGSDAIGGALLATPVRPSLVGGDSSWSFRPRAILKTGGADRDIGGRAQFELGYKDRVGFFGGVGYRDVGQLRAGGPILEPRTGEPFRYPLFERDGVTQHGTGFRELAHDGRLSWELKDGVVLSAAYYDYRQFDAPRTDKCPAPTAPLDECYLYDEQFRTLVYTALDVARGPAFAEDVRVRLNYQRAHERWRYDYGDSGIREYENVGRDDVNTAGVMASLQTRAFRLAPEATLRVGYGADGYFDHIGSRAWTIFFDTHKTRSRPRGQHVDGSRYFTTGAWSQLRFRFWDRLGLRAGGRLAYASAFAEDEPESASPGVDAAWTSFVGDVGLSLALTSWLTVVSGVNQGYRAPNLSDLTSRQFTGPGFQVGNPSLTPERSTSYELGLELVSDWVEMSTHVFQTHIDDKIERALLPCADVVADGSCPFQYALQPINLRGRAIVRGVDGVVRLRLPQGFGLRTTLSYAWGEGDNTNFFDEERGRVPLSRVPPLNGTGELTWSVPDLDIVLGAAIRWQALQDRLAPSDFNDPRIPDGGTPAYAVFDLRAAYRLWQPHLLLSLVLENVGDAPYRTHGSGINGPGRSLNAMLELGF